jgi:hypothetical protein
MLSNNIYHNIKHIVSISSNVGTACEHCDFSIGLENFAESVNHYINKHGYTLLYVGGETSDSDSGVAWQGTVAIVGK